MNLVKLSWRNLLHKPGSMLLSLILFALGVGLISFLLLLDTQLQEKFERNLAEIDLVVGAKGSPLQLILNSMYHIDAPTGNIKIESAKPFLNPKNPLIDKAVPLSLGDSYKGYRIIGTTQNFLEQYQAEVAKGKLWEKPYQVNLGAEVAQKLNLKLGDEFQSTHGYLEDEQMEHDHAHNFEVVGIISPTGSVADQLILTGISTYWLVHGQSDNNKENQDSTASSHKHHDHDQGHDQEFLESSDLLNAENDKEITSLLLTFKGRNFQSLNLARNINENTDMLAASPAIEINRLFSLMDTGSQMLRFLAIAIIIVSGLSVFISLYSKLRSRKYELAFMRVKGASRTQLFLLIILEGLIIACLGTIIGILLAHLSMYLLAGSLEESYKYTFSAFTFLLEEVYVCFVALLIGVVASVIPAWQASSTDISDTLSNS